MLPRHPFPPGPIPITLGVGVAWVRRLRQRRRQTGSFAAKPRGGGAPTKMTEERRGRLLVLVAQQPDATRPSCTSGWA